MPIKISQLSRYPSGKINPSATLCNIINAQIDTTSLKVTSVDFLSLISEQPLAFRIQLKHDFHHDLSQLTNLLSHFTIQTNEQQTSSEIHISNPRDILQIFNHFEYNSLKEADLLQLLLAETVYMLINKHHDSTPKLVEFDKIGNISAIICSNLSRKQYKLENIQDVCLFLIEYCDVTLPTHFMDLLHQQLAIQAMREIQALTLVTDIKLPAPLFYNNKFLDAKFISSSKQLVFTLKPCSEREAIILTHVLSTKLGDDFIVSQTDNQLSICPANADGFTQINVKKLYDLIINELQLLTKSQADDLFANDIIGAPIHSMPESVEKILSCKISFELPSGTPYITPHGLSYDHSSIMKNIEIYGDDPFTKDNLEEKFLRPNLLIERIIASYHRSTIGYTATIPHLLLNPKTNSVYINPVVLENGETVDRHEVRNTEVYPNRDLANLIEYYTRDLYKRYDLEVLSNLLRDGSIQHWRDKPEYLTALQAKINESKLTLSTKINHTPITYNQAEIEQHYTFTLSELELLRTKMTTRTTYPKITPPARLKDVSKSKRYYAELSPLNIHNLFSETPVNQVPEHKPKHAKLS